MKTVGIIGGLGPETTANFYLKVVFSFFEINTIQRPSMHIVNVPINFSVEHDVIIHAKNQHLMLPFLIDAAQKLERGGADFIVIPCNTVHIFIEDIRKSVNIPVLSIIEETTEFLTQNSITSVGLLGTNTTISNHLYDTHLNKKGIATIIPSDTDQRLLNELIVSTLQRTHSFNEKKKFRTIMNTIRNKNVDALLLACTDLHILLENEHKVQCIDTLNILVQSTIRELFANED